MHSTTRRLSLIGIALLLTHCAQSGDETTSPNQQGEGDHEVGSAKTVAERGSDSRDSLDQVSGGERSRRTSDLEKDARAYAASVATRAGVRAATFVAFESAKGLDGRTHVRLNQMHQGVKVWGADVVVHATDAEIVGLAGSVAKLDDVDMTVTLDEEQVLALAKAERFGRLAIETSRESVEKIIYVGADAVPHLAFHSTFYNEFEAGVSPGLWNHVFDAKTGEQLARWNGIDTIAQVSGPGGNPKFAHAWADELDVDAQGASFVMTTTALRTTNLNHSSTGTGTDVTGAVDSFTDPVINDAHGYAEITLNMMKEWMGYDSIDEHGFRIVSRVHYGNNYENAFWNGVQMTYGDGATTFYPLSGAVDVVAHEINHGFTAKHSNLAYSGQPGGLNESFSDIAGKTAEFFYKTAPTFDLGSDIFKTNRALRYMCDPKKDGRSIDHASKMTATLDPHYSSGPPNKVFCRMSKRLSSGDAEGTATQAGVRRAASAFYLANAHYWTSSTTYVQGCQGTVDAARALDFSAAEVDFIKTSWADVGVYCDGLTAPATPSP